MDMKHKEPIYVIGFPKSGNTWLARLLSEVTQSEIEATNVVDGADNSSDKKGSYIIHKQHSVEDVEKVLECKVIFIVRDVRDVLVSAFFFCNTFVCEDWVKRKGRVGWIRGLLYKAYFQHQISRTNEHLCGNELLVILNWMRGDKNEIGSWSDHVLYWSSQPGVLIVRYEDLLNNTEYEMRRILDALGITVDNEKIINTVINQSFDNKKENFLNSDNLSNFKFLRSGKSGGWCEFLSQPMVENIEKKHGDVMRQFGYKLGSKN